MNPVQLEFGFMEKEIGTLSDDEISYLKTYNPVKLIERSRELLQMLCEQLLEKRYVPKWELGSMLTSLAYKYKARTIYTEEFSHLTEEKNEKQY